jgi:hypothetical protein
MRFVRCRARSVVREKGGRPGRPGRGKEAEMSYEGVFRADAFLSFVSVGRVRM